MNMRNIIVNKFRQGFVATVAENYNDEPRLRMHADARRDVGESEEAAGCGEAGGSGGGIAEDGSALVELRKKRIEGGDGEGEVRVRERGESAYKYMHEARFRKNKGMYERSMRMAIIKR
eukprot:evm.model.NODE_31506_length_15132_cov_27.907812.1